MWHTLESNEGKSLMPATAEFCERVSFGWLEFGRRRTVTAEDIRRCAELACRVRLPEDRTIFRARITRFMVDDVPVAEPIGVECERLGAYAVVTVED
jgi:cell division ATPase FtsA